MSSTAVHKNDWVIPAIGLVVVLVVALVGFASYQIGYSTSQSRIPSMENWTNCLDDYDVAPNSELLEPEYSSMQLSDLYARNAQIALAFESCADLSTRYMQDYANPRMQMQGTQRMGSMNNRHGQMRGSMSVEPYLGGVDMYPTPQPPGFEQEYPLYDQFNEFFDFEEFDTPYGGFFDFEEFSQTPSPDFEMLIPELLEELFNSTFLEEFGLEELYDSQMSDSQMPLDPEFFFGQSMQDTNSPYSGGPFDMLDEYDEPISNSRGFIQQENRQRAVPMQIEVELSPEYGSTNPANRPPSLQNTRNGANMDTRQGLEYAAGRVLMQEMRNAFEHAQLEAPEELYEMSPEMIRDLTRWLSVFIEAELSQR